MTEKVETWKRMRSEIVADCRVFRVREDFCERESDRLESTFFVVENPDWVNVIALTKDEEVVLIEQFRHGSEEIILEIPGGMIDAGEDPEAAARRELAEETGFSSGKWILLGKSHPNPAIQDNVIYHFLALDAEKKQAPDFDDHESIAERLVPLADIPRLIAAEEITHSLVLAGFYKMNCWLEGRK